MSRAREWLEIPTDVYLDRRHRNWVLAEELGDVAFVAARGVVLVHRERAEHIARALGQGAGIAVQDHVLALPTPVRSARVDAVRVLRQGAEPERRAVIAEASSHWPTACGWLGIVAGAAVFVAALVLRLDDPALVMALVLGLRGGRLILGVDS
jgi:hypothetical protein